ncbi:hypothetical protein HU200_047688 [Digitaria exilis]|uniref:Uncharacterized protein n=1 Tax=Digitaria exilis TaxID=1010633 RepID=A0A835AW80_9POAL|nr:hypothetical protein HU200_047693 [Digitaria exilis]KAF8675488.1 hypothetical protein HU200_047694 [Digitaria exilis]KAF8675512.1 hypothetical protein HU200_047688 [Digitaria exilis]
MRVEANAAGTPPLTSAQVVNKVLSQDSSKGTFLKNAGIAEFSSRSRSSGEAALRSPLTAEKECSAALQEQMDVLKKYNERTKSEILMLKSQQEQVLRLL